MNTQDLTQGRVSRTLLAFALPFLGANLMQALYGATDLFVVGRFNGASAISAVNIGSQLMQLVTSIVIGCAMGSTVRMGRCIGSRSQEEAARTLGSTVWIFLLLALAVTPVVVVLAPELAVLMQTPADALEETVIYVTVCGAGIPFIIAYNVTAAVLRGVGDSRTPMYIVAVACGVNVAGDFLLTGYFGLGVLGVSIATTAAQLISSLVGICHLVKRGMPFPFHRRDLRPAKKPVRDILFVGLPIAMQDTVINISFLLLTVIANFRGLTASSAVGVVEKVILFLFLVPSAMLSSLSAFTAQNVGAGKPERARSALGFGVAVTMAFGALMCALCWLIPQRFTGLFTTDGGVIEAANQYLKSYSIDCILVGATFGLNGYLCGQGKSLVTFFHNLLSTFLVRVPGAWLLSRLFPATLFPMGLASPLGSLASLGILAGYFALVKRQKNRRN